MLWFFILLFGKWSKDAYLVTNWFVQEQVSLISEIAHCIVLCLKKENDPYTGPISWLLTLDIQSYRFCWPS